MIIREWRGRASKSCEATYLRHFTSSVLPQLRTLAGFSGAQVCCRPKGDLVEVVVLTRWESFDAIRSFAGPNYEVAVVEPAAAAVLTDFDRTVQHYELLLDVSA